MVDLTDIVTNVAQQSAVTVKTAQYFTNTDPNKKGTLLQRLKSTKVDGHRIVGARADAEGMYATLENKSTESLQEVKVSDQGVPGNPIEVGTQAQSIETIVSETEPSTALVPAPVPTLRPRPTERSIRAQTVRITVHLGEGYDGRQKGKQKEEPKEKPKEEKSSGQNIAEAITTFYAGYALPAKYVPGIRESVENHFSDAYFDFIPPALGFVAAAGSAVVLGITGAFIGYQVMSRGYKRFKKAYDKLDEIISDKNPFVSSSPLGISLLKKQCDMISLASGVYLGATHSHGYIGPTDVPFVVGPPILDRVQTNKKHERIPHNTKEDLTLEGRRRMKRSAVLVGYGYVIGHVMSQAFK